jgi:hypothetical protein
MISSFDDSGNLPPGMHEAAWQEFAYCYGELFPAQFRAGGSGETFLEFFQTDKETGNPKGIIVLDLRRLP